MKILLFNPPDEHTIMEYQDENGEGFLESDDYGYFPPLGLLYVLSYLEQHTTGHELFFKDCVAEKISHVDLPGVIGAIQPDIVGITSFTISLIDVVKAARTVREVVPHAHICLGGHHPIAFPLEAAQLEEFDSIVVGEGEIAFTELVEALRKGAAFTGITGVYTRESIQKWRETTFQDRKFLGTVVVAPAYIEDIESLPFPNRRYIKHIEYHSTVGISGKLATIISSRGCPYKCTFCDVPFKSYRARSPGSVLDEVQECLDLGYKEFHFYDDLFNITPKKVLAFCDELERRKMRFIWDFRGRVNSVTREPLERMKKAGCRMISFGVETGSDAGLKALKKATTTEQVRKVFRWCRELGIVTIADFIIGLPFERSAEDIAVSIDFLLELDPDYAQIGILNLYPNTPLFDEAAAKGLIDPQRWRAFSLDPKPGFHVDHWEEHISSHELVRMQRQAYRRFYLRPRYILRSVLTIRTLHEFRMKVSGFLQLIGIR
ncbi:MAG: radical SAM protein [Magnetococcales bacterium]|nr:radical SAM protein [Magnetococcales bacterium]